MGSRLNITEEMRTAARKLLGNRALKFDRPKRDLLTAIADGKRKVIDALWWAKHFKVVDQIKLDKLQRMADPARNPNEHERAVAGRKLDEFKRDSAPGVLPKAPPLPPRIEVWERKLKRGRNGRPARPRHSLLASGGGANAQAAEPAPDGGVNGGVNDGEGTTIWIIYVLIDPRSSEPFYVGCSSDPSARYGQHGSDPGSSAYQRIQELRAAGQSAIPVIVARHTNKAAALRHETQLARQMPGVMNKSRDAKSKRTADRHLNKGDRHRPGYMRDYMRRRREKSGR